MLHARTIFAVLLTTGLVTFSAFITTAQSLSEDEKALATYRLTMPNVKKAMAVVQSFAAEAAKDPKVQEQQKLKKQIDALEEKDELTAAEEAQLDKLRTQLEALEEAEDEKDDNQALFGNAQTIAGMEAVMKKHPAAARALASAGMSAREYSMTMMALLQASLVEGMSQGKVDLKNLPPGVNAANILFVREHKAELEAMQRTVAPRK